MFSTTLKRTPLRLYQSSTNSLATLTLPNPAYLNLVRQLSAFQSSLDFFAGGKKETIGKPSKAKTGLVAEVRESDREHTEGADQSGRDPSNRKYEEWTEKARNEVGSYHKKASFQDPTGGRKV